MILLERLSFGKWLITPDAEHFSPITHALLFAEFKIFGLNFYPYITVAIILHLFNCFILYKLVFLITKNRYYGFFAVSLFFLNLTYTEVFLWLLHGLLLSMSFLGTSFFYWYKYIESKNDRYFYIATLFIIFNGLTYGLGVGTGMVFAAATLLFINLLDKKKVIIYSMILGLMGLFTYFIGPIIVPNFLPHITPQMTNPLRDITLYIAFVFSGVTRGVVGRLFLPGFEPSHHEIILTVISFIPALIVAIGIYWLLKRYKKLKEKLLIISLGIFITFPYLWAGFVRSHFGLKQALAERYAYPSLFFFVILFVLLIKYLIEQKKIRSIKYIIIYTVILVILQAVIFTRNADIFEIRPRKTRNYFSQLAKILAKDIMLLDLPLPSYINQEYRISDLAPVVNRQSKAVYVSPKGDYCTGSIKQTFTDNDIISFYNEQVIDSTVSKEFSREKLLSCISLSNKRI